MIPRGSIAIKASILLNLVLLSTVAYQVHVLQQRPRLVSISPGLPAEPAPSIPAGRNAAAAPLNSDGEKSPPTFAWSQLESSDYRTYIANLRSIGCPDQTVCDIITADVNKLYASRKAALLPNKGRPFKYWETAERSDLSSAQTAELKKEEGDLDREKKSILAELLGADCIKALNPTDQDLELDRKVAFLSPEEQIKSRAILDKYPGLDDRIKAIVDGGSIATPSPELTKLLDQYARKKAELSQVLGPDKYEQYDLSTSWTADNVRKKLMGFNPTEVEFRAIFDIWRAQDESLATIYATGQPDPGTQSVKDAIKASIGDERYEQYSRVWSNDDYHEVAQLTFDYQLPLDTPAQMDSLKQAAQSQQQSLMADSTLTDEQKNTALQTLQAQTVQTASQQLGPDAYQSYLRGNGNWIQRLGTPIANGK